MVSSLPGPSSPGSPCELRIRSLSEIVCTLHVGPMSEVWELKAAVQSLMGLPRHGQRLLAGTQELKDDGQLGPLTTSGLLELTLIRRPLEQAQWFAKLEGDTTVLKTAPESVRGDRELLAFAVQRDTAALQYATKELRSDRSFVLSLEKSCKIALRYVSENLRGDREVVLAAIRTDPSQFRYAGSLLRSDRTFVLSVLRESGLSLKYVASAFQADRDVILAAVTHCGEALKFASANFQADRGVVLAAVQDNGLALSCASLELQADHEVVLRAVERTGKALKYASAELKADRGIVLAAVKSDGWALSSAQCPIDREIVIAAVRQAPGTRLNAPTMYWDDPAVLAACGFQSPGPKRSFVSLPSFGRHGPVVKNAKFPTR